MYIRISTRSFFSTWVWGCQDVCGSYLIINPYLFVFLQKTAAAILGDNWKSKKDFQRSSKIKPMN